MLRGDVDSSIGVVSLSTGSVVVPVEAKAVMEASSTSSLSPDLGDDRPPDLSLFRLPSVDNFLRGSKRRRNPVRGAGLSCEVEGRD